MRAFVACFLALGLTITPAMAAGGNDKTPAEPSSKPAVATAHPAASSPAPASPAEARVENELQQLRDLLDAQTKQIEQQSEQLKEQQKKIDSLESQAKPGATIRESLAAGPATTPDAAGLAHELASAPPTNTAGLSSVSAPPVPAAQSTEELTKRVDTLENKFGKLSDLANGKVKIGATFYGDWAYYTDTGFGPQFLTQINQDGPGNAGFNSFDISRAYINLFYTPNDAVTLRITPNVYRQVDVSNAVGNGKNAGIASSSNGNLGYRLKYAYVDFNTLFKSSDAFKKDKLTVGQQTNPLVDWEEQLYGYRYVNLTPWNYLSLSSTYTGVSLKGPIEFNGKEYLDYHLGVYNTASFHAIETNDKKQAMGRLTWYPLGATADRTSLGLTFFEDYGYNTKTPDAVSTPLNRMSVLVHYQSHSHGLLIAGEYDLGRNAFSTGNLFSGSGPADALGLAPTPTQYAPFASLASAILAGNRTEQQGFDFFGHIRLGNTPFSLFGMYEYFQPNTKISGTDPIDFMRTVGGISYKYNDHFEFSFDDQNLNYFHNQFTMSAAQIATFSPSLAAQYPNGIPNAVPNGTNAVFINLLFNY
jgi:hypothetical protein